MKVESVGPVGGKSVQEQEQEFENQRQAELEAQAKAEAEAKKGEQPEIELDDEKVVGYFKSKYGREVSSINELLTPKQVEEVKLPDAVAGFAKYHKETNRGIEDYIRLNRDLSGIDELSLIKEYRREQDPEATDEEIEFEINEEFGIDSDLDEEDQEYKKVLLKRKKEARQAKKFLEDQKEKYYKPAESAGSIPEEDLEDYKAYKQYIESSKGDQETAQRKAEVFRNETDKVFSEGFEGFKFKINDKVISFKPGDAKELKSLQSSPSNFIKKYLDEDGVIKDAEGYHRDLAFAMNSEQAAKFFYEKGAADRAESDDKKSKNIRMVPNNSGFGSVGLKDAEVVSVSSPSRSSLKIKSRKN